MGTLASLFNSMAARMSSLVGTLEQRVDERTHELERRSTQLQAVIEVSNAITSLRDPDQLLARVTHLISERFGFYHVGIFLLDTNSEYAVLRATNSQGGRRMLARQHKLRVGQSGIVGYATGRKQPRIAMDVGQDAVFFNNPDLPDTRSEMALPLMVGNRVLGALDVQSTKEAAFTQQDVTVLQGLADQVAVALENAHLFTETQQAIEAERRAYGEVSRQAWEQLFGTRFDLGFLCDAQGTIHPATEQWQNEMIQASQKGQTIHDGGSTVAIPIQVRDQVLGVVRLCKPDDAGRWATEEVELVETLTEQLSVALESARLHQDTQSRAERERLMGEITARIRETLDIETVLKTAAQQVRQSLNLPEVVIRLGSAPPTPHAPRDGRNGDEPPQAAGKEKTT
jgi:GAF domain-containing protein